MLTKVKNNVLAPCDLDLLQNLMSSSLAHATPFHQVSLKNQARSFPVILLTNRNKPN